MLNDVDYLLLFEDMLLSEKLSSSNTVRAYKSDIKSFIKYININYDLYQKFIQSIFQNG